MTAALYHARECAMLRLEEEAHLLDADGVVGVQLQVGKQEWAESMAEFTAIGTAVRCRAEDGHRFRKPNGRPFTSDLSGQDFWTLLRTGYRPLELAMGNCVYHVGARGLRQARGQIGQNVEMTKYPQALYDARERAMERMQEEAKTVKADGIVGVQMLQANHFPYQWSASAEAPLPRHPTVQVPHREAANARMSRWRSPRQASTTEGEAP